MKKTPLIIGFLATGIIMVGCKNTTPTTSETTPTEDVATQDANEPQEDSEETPIPLNNGVKWQINEEMMPHLAASEKALQTYVASNETDFATLAKTLEENDAKLIKSCTMKGESHEQLHKWLHPHLELVKELSETTDASKAKAIVEKLEASFKKFHQYFQ